MTAKLSVLLQDAIFQRYFLIFRLLLDLKHSGVILFGKLCCGSKHLLYNLIPNASSTSVSDC